MTPLYKYIDDPQALKFLLGGVCKFTPIAELNDPSELTPTVDVDAIVETLARFRQYGYSDTNMDDLRRQAALLQCLAPHRQAVHVPATREQATNRIRSSFFNDMPLLEQFLHDTAKDIANNVGIFCLSRRIDSLPMWAHYADNARGLIVEFNDLASVFKGDNTGVLREPIAVRYERERVGVTFDPRSHESIFFTKFQDWSQEEEVRVVLPLSDCRMQIKDNETLYLYDIPKTCVSRVIQGWNMTPAMKELCATLVGDLRHPVEMVQARYAGGRVALLDAAKPI